ncbi:MAG: hypothetical protein R3Y09_01115 [Clostridia bacterium]
MKATDFSGTKCCVRYEKEYFDRFTDFLTFYIDGKVLYSRAIHGESAGVIASAWATLAEDGTIIYKKPFSRDVDESVLPKKITKIEGDIFYCDEHFRKWEPKFKMKNDPKNGYSSFSLIFKKLFMKK